MDGKPSIFGHNSPLELVVVAAFRTFQWVDSECFAYPFAPFFRLGHLSRADEQLRHLLLQMTNHLLDGLLDASAIHEYCGAKAPVLLTLAPPSAEDSPTGAGTAPLFRLL